MSRFVPRPVTVLLMVVAAAAWIGLAALGWGGVVALLANPARAGACLVILATSVAAGFTQANLRGLERGRARHRWLMIPSMLFTLALGWLPPYTDARDLWTLDGEIVRYLGLVLLAIGGVLRVGPMFVLQRRFTWPLAQQEAHPLVTTGFYRYIRHPSYLGVIVGGAGWALVFRSGPGLLVMLGLVPVLAVVVPAEEALLLDEFGVRYAEYKRRTWRLLPLIY